MEKCPPEICMQIFKLACTDDGTTGRSLSLVSRYVHDTSRELKYQSVSVVSLAQIMSFAKVLEETPEEYRRVRHLFLSSVPQIEPACHTVQKKIACEQVGEERHYDGVCYAFARILELSAKTLYSFYLVSSISRTCCFVPVTMPALVELTIHGPFPTLADPAYRIFQFKSLRHLRYIGFTDYPLELFEDIKDQAPGITHLSLYPAVPSRNLHDDLEFALDIPRKNRFDQFSFGGIFPPQLPSTIQKVFVQPGPKPNVLQGKWSGDIQLSMTTKLRRMAKRDKRLIFIPSSEAFDMTMAKTKWLQERIDGIYPPELKESNSNSSLNFDSCLIK